MCWMWFLTVPGYVVVAFAVRRLPRRGGGDRTDAGRGARSAGRPRTRWSRRSGSGFPFGGVPLATMGIAQAGGPLLGVARIGGVILLTWIVFQVGCALAGPGAGRSAGDAAQGRAAAPLAPAPKAAAARRAGAAGDRARDRARRGRPRRPRAGCRAAHDRRRAGRRRAGHLGARRAEPAGHRRAARGHGHDRAERRARSRRVAGERDRRRQRAVRGQRRPRRGRGRGGPAGRAVLGRRHRGLGVLQPSERGRVRQRPGRRHAGRRDHEPLREGAHRAVRRVRAVPRAARGARRAARRGAERRRRRSGPGASTCSPTAPGSG